MSFNLFKREGEKKEEKKKTLEDFIKKDDENVEKDENIVNEKESTEESAPIVEETALGCFGWEESKTPDWLAKGAKIWFVIMSFLYFLFGALTFAPMIFIRNKLNSVLNDRKKSLFVAIGIYGIIIVLVVLMILARSTPRETIS